eukprot:TRINITY_DN8537_c0_g1_i1.p1 TRINITY_DN8537_c0_g1~~TRINITY_DN8537_c0_g1_i1.p1  ORF type:complete len:438 (-),score=79.51 TRINITY_DN8537_c0_g1_i1:140-1453(-)
MGPPPLESQTEGSAARTVGSLVNLFRQGSLDQRLPHFNVLNLTSEIEQSMTNNSSSGAPLGLILGASLGGTVLVVMIAIVMFVVLMRRKHQGLNSEQLACLDFGKLNLGSNKAIIKFSELKGLQKIASGGFGIVYRAEFRQTKVAVKQIRAEHVTNEQFLSFVRESEILSKIRPHPNIITFIGFTIPPDDPLSLVTELAEKGNLLDYIGKFSVNLAFKLRMIRGVALGMIHLHAEGVIHRDLALRNVLLDKHLEPKVSDFGLSRIHTDEGPATTVADIGPIKWMAPEAILHKQYSTKSDVFSFGIMMYELISEKEPFKKLSIAEVAIQVVRDGLRPKIPDNCPDTLEKMMRDCWETDPSKRPTFYQIFATLSQAETVEEAVLVPSDIEGCFTKHYDPIKMKHVFDSNGRPIIERTSTNYSFQMSGESQGRPRFSHSH